MFYHDSWCKHKCFSSSNCLSRCFITKFEPSFVIDCYLIVIISNTKTKMNVRLHLYWSACALCLRTCRFANFRGFSVTVPDFKVLKSLKCFDVSISRKIYYFILQLILLMIARSFGENKLKFFCATHGYSPISVPNEKLLHYNISCTFSLLFYFTHNLRHPTLLCPAFLPIWLADLVQYRDGLL